ncbi:MAG: 3-hydroxyacyl-ACP dehydratase FabZ family protein [Pirellulaceae bacterium]|nr:beta-hydroxyacyl-ACP dehydratase [Planctomycetales bacterium]MCA9205553.1 beta-hydroxyacyl-ACP dehydratase [Planctomycetales bacterium]MCA9206789.1 beta-hydroxyacyl-ACP dehydratase [Planctomycetales bacterium]MCA9219569.1 beta-hydroxyacyl-ACP dehydratase [Planctomycetales bacterium]MCA9224189.1 beta-hydroxyacyl-ACP dehydratase [Planctomycetales bacterium]
MRWMWIDRFVEFVSGERAVAIKNVSIAEEPLDGYAPGIAVMPNSLIVEGLAQTGGLLVGEAKRFEERVVLAKLGKAVFHQPAVAGDTLTYTAIVEDIQDDGAIVRAESRIGDQPQADVELFFAHLDERFPGKELFNPEDFLMMLRVFSLYEVGRKPDGSPLDIPERYLEAERLAGQR